MWRALPLLCTVAGCILTLSRPVHCNEDVVFSAKSQNTIEKNYENPKKVDDVKQVRGLRNRQRIHDLHSLQQKVDRHDAFSTEYYSLAEENTKTIKDIILSLIGDKGITEQDKIYDALKELNYTLEFVEEAFEHFPSALKEVNEVFEKAVHTSEEREIESTVAMLTAALEHEADNTGNIEVVLENLSMTIEEVEAFFDAYGHQELADHVIDTYKEADTKRIKFLSHVLGSKDIIIDNDGSMTYIKQGHLQQQIEEIRHEDHSRKLVREPRLKTTREFQVRLDDHINLIRYKILNNDSPRRKLDDTALKSLYDEMSLLNVDVNTALDPLVVILDQIEEAQKSLDESNSAAKIIDFALIAAGYIPYIGPIFKTARNNIVYKTVKDGLEDTSKKASKFEENILDKWDTSIGKVLEMMDSFEGKLEDSAGIQSFVKGVQENQCIQKTLEEIVGFDLFYTIDTALDTIEDYANSLMGAMRKLVEELNGTAWESAASALETLFDVIEPLKAFLKPFEPLANLMQKQIVLPWFKLPYSKNNLGPASCKKFSEVGYYSHPGEFKHTCWEASSTYWKSVKATIPPKLRVTCQHPTMQSTESAFGACINKRISRQKKKLGFGKSCKKKIGGSWMRAFPTDAYCRQKCSGQYSKETRDYCYMNTCPSDYNTQDGGLLCNRKERNKKKHTATCKKYQTNGRIVKLASTGGCFRQCKSGDSNVGGLCFPKAELRISIEMIVDEFNKIIEAIEGLPIVNEINSAINRIVSPILKPVTDIIDDFLKDANLELPTLPEISSDLLPFSELDNLYLDISALDVPSMPDEFFSIPTQFLSKISEIFPEIDVTCGTDLDCFFSKAGLPNLENIMNSIGKVTSSLLLMEDDVKNFLLSIKCKEWKTQNIPIDDALSLVGVDLPTGTCAKDVPICSELDIPWDEIGVLDTALEPFVNFIRDQLSSKSNQAGHRSLIELKGVKFPLISFKYSMGGRVDANGQFDAYGEMKLWLNKIKDLKVIKFNNVEAEDIFSTQIDLDFSETFEIGIIFQENFVPKLFIRPKVSVALKIDVRKGIADIVNKVVQRAEEEINKQNKTSSLSYLKTECDDDTICKDEGKEIANYKLEDKWRSKKNKAYKFLKEVCEKEGDKSCQKVKSTYSKYLQISKTSCSSEDLKKAEEIDGECLKKWADLFKETTKYKKKRIGIEKDKEDAKIKLLGNETKTNYKGMLKGMLFIKTEWLTKILMHHLEEEEEEEKALGFLRLDAAVTPVKCQIAEGLTLGPTIKFDLGDNFRVIGFDVADKINIASFTNAYEEYQKWDKTKHQFPFLTDRTTCAMELVVSVTLDTTYTSSPTVAPTYTSSPTVAPSDLDWENRF